MPRKRVIYQSEALYVSKSDATNGCNINQGVDSLTHAGVTETEADKPKYLQRVQNANYSFSIERQDVNQFGNLAAIDRIILSSPTVSLDFQYLVGNLANENRLGMAIVDTGATLQSAIKNILDKTGDEKCYYIKTVPEGKDGVDQITAVTGTNNLHTASNVIGIGNGYITSYSTEGSVGNFPTCSINVEALNMQVYDTISGSIPAVTVETGAAITNKYFKLPTVTTAGAAANRHAMASATVSGEEVGTISVLRPGDIGMEFKYSAASDGSAYQTFGGDGGGNDSARKFGLINIDQSDTTGKQAKLQSYNFSFDISRTPLEKLGSKFAFSREIDFPVTVSMSIEGNVSDMAVVTESTQTSELANLVDEDGVFWLKVILNAPGSAVPVVSYNMKGAKLDSQEFSSGIGDNKSVTLNFSTQIGGPDDTVSGFYLEGAAGSY